MFTAESRFRNVERRTLNVELPDGRTLTAYSAQRVGDHKRYHMGLVAWNSAQFGMKTK
jgi:hypothetical protein